MDDDRFMGDIEIKETLTDSFMAYANAVNLDRSIPDLRDGLKPVQRRILITLMELQGKNKVRYYKSARVVGECMGKYHPHGDSSIYEASVNMATDFNNRIPLIKGQGNFGTDSDSPAASRYTEMKLSEYITRDLEYFELTGLPKTSTYDDNGEEFTLLDLGFPNILVNGASGIGVSISTYIPSFNPRELIKALEYMVKREGEGKNGTIKGIARYIKGVDFPTGGNVYSLDWLKILEYGKGRVTHEATLEYVDRKIIIKSIPTEISSVRLIKSIGKIAKELGIKDMVEYSNNEGVNIELIYKRDVSDRDANILYNRTLCSITKSVSMNVCSESGVGRKGVLDILEEWLEFTFTNKMHFHIRSIKILKDKMEYYNLIIYMFKHMDKIIKIIKGSKTLDIAISRLLETYDINDYQAKVIVNLKLNTITEKYIARVKGIIKEYQSEIKYINKLINNPLKVKKMLVEEADDILKTSSKRKSKVIPYINRNIDHTIELIIYITPEKVFTVKKSEEEGNYHVLRGDQTLVFITNESIIYRIPVNRITDIPTSPMAYITPRDNKSKVVLAGVYVEGPMKLVGNSGKKYRPVLPEKVVIGSGGKFMKDFKQKKLW